MVIVNLEGCKVSNLINCMKFKLFVITKESMENQPLWCAPQTVRYLARCPFNLFVRGNYELMFLSLNRSLLTRCLPVRAPIGA